MAAPRRPLKSRPLDAIYAVWFALHLVIMFAVDLVPIYKSFTPTYLSDLRQWYISTYNDRFFTHPPAWFTAFMWMEALYHVPLSLWAVPALIRDDPLVPLHLLIWSVQTFITTLVCIVEFVNWPGVTQAQIKDLSGLYVPYCLLSALMGLETFWRLKSTLNSGLGSKKTQ